MVVSLNESYAHSKESHVYFIIKVVFFHYVYFQCFYQCLSSIVYMKYTCTQGPFSYYGMVRSVI